MEFDADGHFIRGFGDGLFDRPHGLRIDQYDNIWATDVAMNLVYKFNPSGRIEMVLGVKGRTGEWHPGGHLRLFHEPNEAVIGPTGDLYVLEGHGKAESRVVKFDCDGNFIKSWGGKGKGPGQFDLPHSLVFDQQGLLYIADRNNARIQVFDADGTYIRESSHPGTPCGLFMGADHIWLAHGHTGQIMKLDLAGQVVGKMAGAGPGKSLGKYGEAHYHRSQPARRDLRRRHTELARAEVCEEVGGARAQLSLADALRAAPGNPIVRASSRSRYQ